MIIPLKVILSTYFLTPEAESVSCSNTSPCTKFQTGEVMKQCPELVSTDGFLAVTLEVRVGVLEFDWLTLPLRTYNGTACPFTWKVKPGDNINVTLINSLGPNPAETPPSNFFRLQNTTNLHTHGLHISPLAPQDDVFIEVGPGEKYEYSYHIEQDHSSGTYWYHPHIHGSGELQVGAGMAGLIIVEDNPTSTPAELRDVSCPENCQHDLSFIIQGILASRYVLVQRAYGDDLRQSNIEIAGGGSLDEWMRDNVNYATINGQLMPQKTIERGQVKRFRFLNAGPKDVIELELVPVNGSTTSCEIREIAIDGVYLDKPRELKHGQSLVLPGGRMDWMVRCDEAGSYELKTTPRTVNDVSIMDNRWHEHVLVTIKVVSGDAPIPTMNFPELLPARPRYNSDLRNVSSVDQTIVLEVSDVFTINREQWSGPTDYRYKMEVDSVVEIQLLSTVPNSAHTMHFHVNHAQVIEYKPYDGPWSLNKPREPVFELYEQESGEACFYQHPRHSGPPNFTLSDPLWALGHEKRWNSNGNYTLGYPQAGEWRDTFLVQGLANITLRMRLHKFTGPLLYHCHIIFHSDRGMMLVMEIVEKGGNPTGARIDSNGVFPGSCRRCDSNLFKDIPSDCHVSTHGATAGTTATTTTPTTKSGGKYPRPSWMVILALAWTTGNLVQVKP